MDWTLSSFRRRTPDSAAASRDTGQGLGQPRWQARAQSGAETVSPLARVGFAARGVVYVVVYVIVGVLAVMVALGFGEPALDRSGALAAVAGGLRSLLRRRGPLAAHHGRCSSLSLRPPGQGPLGSCRRRRTAHAVLPSGPGTVPQEAARSATPFGPYPPEWEGSPRERGTGSARAPSETDTVSPCSSRASASSVAPPAWAAALATTSDTTSSTFLKDMGRPHACAVHEVTVVFMT